MFRSISLGRAEQSEGVAEVIDGISVPQVIMGEASDLAEKHQKIFFIGVMFERNPDWKETAETRYTYQPERLRETGDFVIADDHDFVASYKGSKQEFIGSIVTVVPSKMLSETYRKQREAKSNYVVPFEGSRDPGTIEGSDGAGDPVVDHTDCLGCNRPIPIYANPKEGLYTDKSTGRIQRGTFAWPNELGEFEGENADSPVRDNISVEKLICSRCWLTDPDLARFFQRVNLRSR